MVWIKRNAYSIGPMLPIFLRTNLLSDTTMVVSVGASKVYVEPGDGRGPALTFGLVVIGDGHPDFNITSQGIPLKDLLELASALTGN